MTTYGPPGSGQPDDPQQRPPTGSDGSPPVNPTLPQWGPPPPADDPTRQQWGPPPSDPEPPTAPMWAPPPTSGPGQPPASGPGYPPTSGAGYPPASGPGHPPPGPFPPAGPVPGQPPAPWGPPPPGGFGVPPVPPAKNNGRKVALIIGLVVLLLLCPCLGLAGWAIWRVADAGNDVEPRPSVSMPVRPPVVPSAVPTPDLPDLPDPDEEFARGDCVVNEGTEEDAELRKVPCGPNTYQVLLRIPATTDGDRCETLAPQATANYVHDNSIDLFDYVLCLKER
ncbi:hypothetical protein O7617_12290 [Micromonospora sp. WMMD1155]|nr:hypothetical protein [Micromonospora sp. WMMD1155]WFE51059.1 hypothetical protein O7617_12290 [Micromonospora sp. WMMD1155]